MSAKTLATLERVAVGTAENLHRVAAEELSAIAVPVETVPRMRVISGFSVPDGTDEVADPESVARRAKAEARVRHLHGVREQQAIVREQFEREGIIPLAVVPQSLWNGLCKHFGLVRFEWMSSKGNTGAPGLDDFAAKTLFLAIALFTGLVSSVVTLMLVPGMGDALVAGAITLAAMAGIYVLGEKLGEIEEGWKFFAVFITLGACIGAALTAPVAVVYTPLVFAPGAALGGILVLLIASDSGERLRDSLVGATARLVLRIMSHRKLVNVLFPDGVDGGGSSISVRFSDPPSDVIEVLKKVGDMDVSVSVAADPAAIILNKDEIVKRMKDFAADPVVYVVSGDMVAILAQFGDFPDEKDVVEAAQRIGIPLR